MLKKVFIYITIILFILAIVSFSIINVKNGASEEDKLNSKLNEEIEYLSKNIIEIINGLNNIKIEDYRISVSEENITSGEKESQNQTETSGDEKESTADSGNTTVKSGNQNTMTNFKIEEKNIDNINPDWEKLNNKISKLYSIWAEIVIDLDKVNINNEDIVAFSKNIDEAQKYINAKDKVNSLTSVATLYSYIPKFTREYSQDNRKVSLLDTKSNILNAYSLIEQEKWNDIKNYITTAETSYSVVLNDVKNNKNQYNINKTYILLQEFKTSIDNNNKTILYLKYKNLIEEIEIIEV